MTPGPVNTASLVWNLDHNTQICRNTFLDRQSERYSGLPHFEVGRQGQSQLQWFLRAQFCSLHK